MGKLKKHTKKKIKPKVKSKIKKQAVKMVYDPDNNMELYMFILNHSVTIKERHNTEIEEIMSPEPEITYEFF